MNSRNGYQYLRALIRLDREQGDQEKWKRLYTALAEGLSIPVQKYRTLSADEVKQRARQRNKLTS